jgi:hypothetical protein
MIPFEQLLAWKEAGSFPDDIPPLLYAMLLESAGDWDSAHSIAQNDPSVDGSWVHAYLHRVEGDQGNASYWYHNAGKIMPDISLDEEWEYIAMTLAKKS